MRVPQRGVIKDKEERSLHKKEGDMGAWRHRLKSLIQKKKVRQGKESLKKRKS